MRADPAHACLFCEFCRYRHFPAANADGVQVLGTGTGHTCSLCREEFVTASLEGVPVEYCEACRGVLVELPAFGRLVPALRAGKTFVSSLPALDPKDLERRLDCPVCLTVMDTHVYGGPGNFVIDNCPRCLVNFLDHHELKRIAVAPEAPGPEPVPPPPAPEFLAVHEKKAEEPDLLMAILRRFVS